MNRTVEHRGAAAALPVAARRHPLVREVDRQLALCGLTNADIAASPTRPVVLGVSGGADSVALLLACVALQRRKRRLSAAFQPVAVHVHHHLRAEADDDAEWVQALCMRLRVECHIEHVRPGELKGNGEANARRLRYAALARVAADVGAQHVLTAHHANDQLETMLMAMCRGAGPRGMAGMRMARPMGTVTLARPLLRVGKRECEEMCRTAGIEWREDATNRDVSRRRARLRREVLPVLEELWPGAAKRASRNARLLERAQRRV
jgi:tRNA(Ile)-lysidine synthase